MKKVKKTSVVKYDLRKAPKTPISKKISPMLATLADGTFDEPGWLYEIKWDGYRAVAFCNKNRVSLMSRNQKSFSEKFYPILDALKHWNVEAVVDGEITVLNNRGISHFGALQNWRSEADGELIYYVFDLLWLNGHNLMGLPLVRRRELLKKLLTAEGSIRLSEQFDTGAREFLATAGKLGLEGIIAKKADSLYHPGDRSRDWLKMKIDKRHEVVIGGYTCNKGSSKVFSSLLVGVFVNGKLQYTGKVGTGFSMRQQKEMIALFKPLIIQKSAFLSEPDINKPSRFRPDPPEAKAVWLRPRLVCEVHYTEITADGVMRHPSFEAMREDKEAKDVGPEKILPLKRAVKESGGEKSKKSGTPRNLDLHLKAGKNKDRHTLLNPTEETQVRTLDRHDLRFSHLSKIYWPKSGYSKRDLLNYYYQAGPYILPYLKDRPQSLNRFPNGINGKSFYQKDVTATAPDWVRKFPYHTSTGEDKNFLVVEGEASLLWMANLGAIEMNPWNSTIFKPDNPDWCIIDIDPTEKNSFDQVILTAQVVKKVLDELKIAGYCKTSGSTGMHIYFPLSAQYSYDQCQLLGKWIASRVHDQLPGFTSIERMTNKRRGKIYVDYLQNRPQATLAAPYSVRPKPGATVSMPLHWDEVKKGLKMMDFTIQNAIARIRSEGDLFKPVLGKEINLKKVLSIMHSLE
ncbi:MAG: DNA ligase D [Chitinophagales bacterium]